MLLLLSPALAQWATFEPPSSAPSLAPWQDEQRVEVGASFITGLGGDGTTLTDSDFPGPGFLDLFADLQLSGAYQLRPRVDVVATTYLGSGSILGGGAGVRLWVARSELGGLGMQLDAGLIYLRASLPMVARAGAFSFYCAPTVQAAVGAQARTPFGVTLALPQVPGLLLTLESGFAVTGVEGVPDWDEGVKYYASLSVAYRAASLKALVPGRGPTD